MSAITLPTTFTRDSLPDALRRLAARMETGELNLVAGSLRAIINLEHGELVHARFGTRVGEEALTRILVLESGTFEFVAGQAVRTRTIECSLERLLSSAFVDGRLTQESIVVLPTSVVFAREADSAKPINLMRIHWQIIKHVNGHHNLLEIARQVGLSFDQLERPVRDLILAGLIGLEAANEPDGGAPVHTSFGAITDPSGAPSVKDTSQQTSERKRELFGFLRRSGKTTVEKSITGQTLVGGFATEPDVAAHAKPAQRGVDPAAQLVDGAFLQHLHKLLSTYVGPMAEFALIDAAEALGLKPGRVPVGRLRGFAERLTQEVMPERQSAFHAQVSPLIDRYLQRVNAIESQEAR